MIELITKPLCSPLKKDFFKTFHRQVNDACASRQRLDGPNGRGFRQQHTAWVNILPFGKHTKSDIEAMAQSK